MKKVGFILLLMFGVSSYAQTDIASDHPDSLRMYVSDPVPVYTKAYMNQYRRYKRIIVKVYPYALYAADVLYELEEDAEEINKRRKKKRLYKDTYKDLKSDFKYFVLDLYTSEGRMLMKLVHRETGMTVFEIAEKYRGKGSAFVFETMGKIWDQDVNVKYDPIKTDKIAEHVIQDIESGIISFNKKVDRIEKEEYKTVKQERKKRIRKNKKQRRKSR
ncbi:MAG: DUF4294 domain-containing protein [Crocinitomicaceae bacterium]